jgi:hypothetical protein
MNALALVLYIVRILHVVKGAAQGLTRCAYSNHWADNYALKSLLQFFSVGIHACM